MVKRVGFICIPERENMRARSALGKKVFRVFVVEQPGGISSLCREAIIFDEVGHILLEQTEGFVPMKEIVNIFKKHGVDLEQK